MRIFITGAGGKLGSSLSARLSAHHEVVGADHNMLDITDFQTTRQQIGDAQPDLVLHAAAWTQVDACALDPDQALRVNGLGAQNVALAAASAGAAVVYISSNEVFNGKTQHPYHEYASPHPINAYGMSKWVGEQTTMRATNRHYIVRTAWLFAHGGRNFVHVVLQAAAEGRPLRIVTNEIANPTYNDDLADAVAALIETERYGTYHLVNEGFCSRLTLARYILERAGKNMDISGITSHQWARASHPPEFTPLANLAGALVGIRLRAWQSAVDAFLEREGFPTA